MVNKTGKRRRRLLVVATPRRQWVRLNSAAKRARIAAQPPTPEPGSRVTGRHYPPPARERLTSGWGYTR